LQIAKKNKGKAEDVIDFPSYNYAQAARSHVKMFIMDSHGLDLGSPLICRQGAAGHAGGDDPMPGSSRGGGSSVWKAAGSHPTKQHTRGGFDTMHKDGSNATGSPLTNSFTSETAVQEACSEEDRSSTICENDTEDSGFFGTGSCS